jgi:hypothetical protein
MTDNATPLIVALSQWQNPCIQTMRGGNNSLVWPSMLTILTGATCSANMHTEGRQFDVRMTIAD